MRLECAICCFKGLVHVLSLGEQPLANNLLRPSQLWSPENVYPLDLLFCPSCSLVQLAASVPPTQLFDEYAYFSSQSATMAASAKALIERLTKNRRRGGFVVEIASNDGYLLNHYAERGVRVLGVDPALNVVRLARERGVPTLCEYFSEQLAQSIAKEHGLADIIHANNMIAHVPDPVDVLRGIKVLLEKDGLAVIEFPWVKHMIDRVAFDTIYHEHLFYYSLTAFDKAVQSAGLICAHVEELDLHGGSLRVFLRQPEHDANPTVRRFLEHEARSGVTALTRYSDLEKKVKNSIELLEAELQRVAESGGVIAGYGAAAKATVLLNSAPRAAALVKFIVDSTPYKQGRYVPGVRIPIHEPQQLLAEMPSHTVIFAWNFADEIVRKETEYMHRGGRFLVPLPTPRYLMTGATG